MAREASCHNEVAKHTPVCTQGRDDIPLRQSAPLSHTRTRHPMRLLVMDVEACIDTAGRSKAVP